MKLSDRKVLEILKEEYNKRISHYLSEIEVKDGSDNDLIAAAEGLKVKDKAGYVYTVHSVVNDEGGRVVVRLLPPEEARAGFEEQGAVLRMNEDEGAATPIEAKEKENDKEESKEKTKSKKGEENSKDIIDRNPDAKFKRSFDVKISEKPYFEDSPVETGPDGSPYISVDIDTFEKSFTL